MTKKQLKRIIKKKVKKNLRHRLMKNKNQTTNEQTAKSGINSSPIASGLRSQLLQRAGLGLSFGYMPQQYGNVNNERKINQLKNSNQTMNQQINNDKATIDAMNQEKSRLDAEIKDLKKQKKEAKKKLDKATNEREQAEDEASEAERTEQKTRKELTRKNIAEKRMQEIMMANNIVKHKMEADILEAATHKAEMENQTLKRKYEDNHAFQELQKRQADLKKIVNENTALAETINSDEFIDSNKKLIDVIKEQEKEKLRNDLLKKKRQKEQESINAKIALQSQPDEQYTNFYTDQVSKEIGEIEKEIFIINANIQEAKEPIERYEYSVQKLKEANNKLFDAKYEYSSIQAKQSKLNAEAKDNELQKNIEKQMEDLGTTSKE